MKEVGKVIWFNAEKGFGFIARENGEDLFVHFQDIQMDGYKTLNKDDIVSYTIEETPKGNCAREVEIIERAEDNEQSR